jgi:hypothetical protein
MSFNVPTFSIPGMMPTTHPVQDSITTINYDGSADVVVSVTEDPPSTMSFRVVNYSGKLLLLG